jgi:hypothetical protein
MDTLQNALRNCSWKHLAALPRARMIGLLLIVVLPGGFAVPACWAAVFAIRRFIGSGEPLNPAESSGRYRAAWRRLARDACTGILR